MPSYIIDRRDIDFILYEQFDLAGLSAHQRYQGMSRDDFDAVLDAAVKLATDLLAPTFAEADQEGCRLEDGNVYVPQCYVDAYKQFAEGGWIAMTPSDEHGGMGLPFPLSLVMQELTIGASSSFTFYSGLAVSAGHVLEEFGSPELRDLLVPKLFGGEWGATMCLTEAQAGTAVGDLRTTATPIEGSDQYAIVGTKQFITAGDHQINDNILHLVLARVAGDPAGVKGISLFLVPKHRFDADGNITEPNDVAVTAIEEKLGIHGSSTCSLAFGDNGNCRGYLIGERCKGIVAMFQMMNEARILTGLQAIALGNAAYQWALAYARDRIQGTRARDMANEDAERVAIIEHPDVRRNLMLCKAIGEGGRALLFRAAFHYELAEHHDDEAERAKNRDLLDLLTPICKAWGSDMGFLVTERAMQVMGGYGYIREYGVEQCMRDAKIASIYEGTNGVQALDLLGRKMRAKGGMLFMTYLQEVNGFLDANKDHPRLAPLLEALEKARNLLGEVAMGFAQRSKDDLDLSLLHATPFLDLFGTVEVGRLLVEQAVVADRQLEQLYGDKSATRDEDRAKLIADNADARFYDGKVKTARFYVSALLPRAFALGKEIKSADRSALDICF